EVAKFDFWLRNAFLDNLAPPSGAAATEEASGFESAVFASADAAATASGLDLTALASRAAAFERDELRRLRGRAAAGLFESPELGQVTTHLAAKATESDSYAFRAYCRWRAYNEALVAAGAGPKAAIFGKSFGQRLLVDALGAPPQQSKVSRATAKAFVDGLQVFLDRLVSVGLVSRAKLEVDEVLLECWTEGSSRDLVLTALVEGDPLVDAQILLSEERAPVVSPSPVLAALDAWLSDVGGGGVEATLRRFYVASQFQRNSDRKELKYVSRQQLVQLTLSPSQS
ncbi:unnamed protein product, partial [Polarella glacialis]